MENQMKNQVKEFMLAHQMVEKKDHVIIGVSGGADSVGLLLILCSLRQELDFTLSVVHVEHGVRGEDSIKDAKFTKDLCEKMNLPFKQYSGNMQKMAEERGISEEEAGRQLRYEFFEQEVEEWTKVFSLDRVQVKIAVAHHQGDQAETMLFRMARGTGIKGLCGMYPKRGQIIRPLLSHSRKEIERYLDGVAQPFCLDASNSSLKYSRNRIRHQVIEELEQINSCAKEHLFLLSEEVKETEDYLLLMTKEAYRQCVIEEEDELFLLDQNIKQFPLLIQKKLLHHCVDQVADGAKDVTREHIQQLLALFDKGTGKKVNLPKEVIGIKEAKGLRIAKQKQKKQIEEVFLNLISENSIIQVDLPKGILRMRVLDKPQIESFQIPQKKYTKLVDYDKIMQGLQVRSRRQGDYIVTDSSGRHQKLKAYFINEKIPHQIRDQIPLVTDGSSVIWILGYRISAYYKVTKDTQKIVELNYMEDEKA